MSQRVRDARSERRSRWPGYAGTKRRRVGQVVLRSAVSTRAMSDFAKLFCLPPAPLALGEEEDDRELE